tara:strand:+ start:1720 stop:2682 length:963 start_codon:yes stop_codon:yes gene_type:complete
MKNCKIDVNLSDRNRARLESRPYESNYTDVPNRALPESLKAELGVIYEALTGESLPEDSNTFTVRADGGTFKRLYSPTVMSTEGNEGIIIRWGDRDIPVSLAPGKVSVDGAAPKAKFAFKDDTIGKYEEPVLSVSIASSGVLYTMPFPVRSADWENRVNGDILDALLEESPEKIAENLAIAGDPSKRGEGGPRLNGYIIKVSELPLGSYTLTAYRPRETQYGMDYLIQAVIDEPFVATTRVKDEVTEEWGDAEVEVSGFAIVKPNNALKKLLAADPIIAEDTPATLSVLEHGEYNGFKTAKVTLRCTAFVQDDASFSLDF